jgi:HD-GYP domain-containing protein (c-di-GMP phosphodiesterase class II)
MTLTRARVVPADTTDAIRLSDLIAALSHALDLAEGQPEGHACRSALIGMRLAAEIGLEPGQRPALLHALLLKDLGASAIASRLAALYGADERAVRREWRGVDASRLSQVVGHVARNVLPGGLAVDRALRALSVGLASRSGARQLVALRAEAGAREARLMGFPEETAAAIAAIDERWDGQGQPAALDGDSIPLLARVASLAQAMESWIRTVGREAAYDMVWVRRGHVFDPTLVDALFIFRSEAAFWERVCGPDPEREVSRVAPEEPSLAGERLDAIAASFGRVTDAKSMWTRHHSPGVAALADGAAAVLSLDQAMRSLLRRAALLHDLGKLGLSTLLLDRPGNLTEADRVQIRRHPLLTRQILARAPGFQPLADLAGAHHERLDGRGYPDGLEGSQLSLPMRILAVADIAEALVADRPFRHALPPEKALAVMRRDVGTGLCPVAFDALESFLVRASLPLVKSGAA